ncbi:MAG: hypothetical protein INF65_09475 [Roseomonas sp.]|nr:hypothetical protein [Roseomonas sp.]MCA3407431.1 hypothetical protein [Roseomonas sp.]
MIRLMTLALIALAACSALDAPVAQLERWQKQRAAGALAAIADEPVVRDCAPGKGEACQRLHLIRAEACLSLAFADRAPGAACPGASAREAGLLSCAASAAQAAEQSAGEILLPARKLRAQARLCAIENLPPAMAAPAAREFIAEAAPLADAEGALLRGRALLTAARPSAGPEATRCAAARDALAEARRGLAQKPDDAALKRLADDAALRATRISDCRI